MSLTWKSVLSALIKLAIAATIVLVFVEANISVQLILIYLLYMMFERSNELSELTERFEIQKERIDELESKIDDLESQTKI